MNKIDISFVIPAYGREDLLKETLTSIYAQKLVSLEIIVVDDFSPIPLIKILSQYFPKVKFVRLKKNLGPSGARNMGMKKAKGEFVCLLDSDDLVDKNFSYEMIKALKTKKEGAILCLQKPLFSDNLNLVRLIYCWILNNFQNFVTIYCWIFKKKLEYKYFFAAVISRIVFFRKSLTGMKFNEKMVNCEDWYFILKFMKKNNLYILPQKLVTYRYSSISTSKIKKRSSNWKFYDKIISMFPKESGLSPVILAFRAYKLIFRKFNL